jgi:hypothetical protein
MTRLRILIPAVLAVCSLPVFAQKNPCDLVTQTEAAVIVGSPVDKQVQPAACIYKAKGSNVSLHVRLSKSNPTAATTAKTNFSKSGIPVKDEPSLGAGSYSAVWPNSDRIYVLKGDQMLRIDYVSTASKAPDAMMAKLRDAAKKALGRL